MSVWFEKLKNKKKQTKQNKIKQFYAFFSLDMSIRKCFYYNIAVSLSNCVCIEMNWYTNKTKNQLNNEFFCLLFTLFIVTTFIYFI